MNPMMALDSPDAGTAAMTSKTTTKWRPTIMPTNSKKYAVTRQWKDNPSDFQVLEYFGTILECKLFIAGQRADKRYRYDVAEWV